MRAIEQGLPLARAANTGISAMIDPYGRVIASLGLGEAGYVDVELPGALLITGYVRFGDFPALIVSALLLGLTFAPLFSGSFLKVDDIDLGVERGTATRPVTRRPLPPWFRRVG